MYVKLLSLPLPLSGRDRDGDDEWKGVGYTSPSSERPLFYFPLTLFQPFHSLCCTSSSAFCGFSLAVCLSIPGTRSDKLLNKQTRSDLMVFC